jgi:hypothetical protein
MRDTLQSRLVPVLLLVSTFVAFGCGGGGDDVVWQRRFRDRRNV